MSLNPYTCSKPDPTEFHAQKMQILHDNKIEIHSKCTQKSNSAQKCKFQTKKLQWHSKQTGQNYAFRKLKFCTKKEFCAQEILPIPWKVHISVIFCNNNQAILHCRAKVKILR